MPENKQMSRPLWVVKVGGSLFDLPDLGDHLRRWLAGPAIPSDHAILLVPGGGPTTDVIRALDRQHGLGEEKAHWLALRALTLNAYFLADLLPGVPVVADPRASEEADQLKLRLLDMAAFARIDEQRHGQQLPHTWDVTSDSLAIRVAVVTEASGLVLLKSTTIPTGLGWEEASRLGLVDRPFAGLLFAATGLEVKVVNFLDLVP